MSVKTLSTVLDWAARLAREAKSSNCPCLRIATSSQIFSTSLKIWELTKKLTLLPLARRMISLNLRHGTPIQYVVEQLTKDKYAEMTSFSKVVATVLKTYIKDGVKLNSDKKCDNCKESGGLYYYDGCLNCSLCKTSKCG